MNNLLIFFAIPLATIIIAIVLERVWKNYILVTLFAFAIFLIVAFAVGDSTLLVLVIIYTILAFLAAFLSMLFRKICKRLRNLEDIAGAEDEEDDRRNRCRRRPNNNDVGGVNESNNCNCNCNCNCGRRNDSDEESATDNNNCGCNNSQNLAINATVTPNSSNNGRTGTFRGRYRRRF